MHIQKKATHSKTHASHFQRTANTWVFAKKRSIVRLGKISGGIQKTRKANEKKNNPGQDDLLDSKKNMLEKERNLSIKHFIM